MVNAGERLNNKLRQFIKDESDKALALSMFSARPCRRVCVCVCVCLTELSLLMGNKWCLLWMREYKSDSIIEETQTQPSAMTSGLKVCEPQTD